MNKTYYFSQEVNFPDIDLGGGMYHGRYLDYYDRARQKILTDNGISFGKMLKEKTALVVAEMNLQFKKPIFFEDRVYIYSKIISRRDKSLQIEQIITTEEPDQVGNEPPKSWNNKATFTIVCADLVTKRATSFPEYMEPIFS